jgi:hypothetical protein
MSRDVHSCTHCLRPRTPPPSPRIWAHIRERYWSAKIDDISLNPLGQTLLPPYAVNVSVGTNLSLSLNVSSLTVAAAACL